MDMHVQTSHTVGSAARPLLDLLHKVIPRAIEPEVSRQVARRHCFARTHGTSKREVIQV